MGLFGGRDMCKGTCKDGSECRNFVSSGEMYCRHHKEQMTAQDKRELERREKKNTMVVIVGLIIFVLLCFLAAAGG